MPSREFFCGSREFAGNLQAILLMSMIASAIGPKAAVGSCVAADEPRRAVLRIEVSLTSSKTGVAYEYGHGPPATPAHDRGHECAQALCRHAEEPHPQLQAFSLHSNGLPERRRLRNWHVGVTGPEPPFLLT